MHYVLFLERLYFLLCVYLLFNKVGPIIFCLGERYAPHFLYRALMFSR
jgi:hypothetical protein